MQQTLAIIGATGNVGRKIITILEERNLLKQFNLRLFASSNSAGKKLSISKVDYLIEDINTYDFKQCNIALFATDSDISEKYIPIALAEKSYVVDSSSLFRLDSNVPLIVPPVNADLITPSQQLYATANCLACPISVVTKPLHEAIGIKRILASTYQSASGAGKALMDRLQHESSEVINASIDHHDLHKELAFNVIPQIDKVMPDGFTYEEFKIMREIQKVVSPNIKVTATSVRVPVMVGHGISLAIEFSQSFTLDSIKGLLKQASHVQLSDHEYTTPREVEGKDDVFVGRIRKDPSIDNGVQLWLMSDNLRRGAALDVVEIVERIATMQLAMI